MNKQQSYAFCIIKDTYEVVGPIKYDFMPGTTYIVDYNRLAHEQYPELDRDAVIIEDCKILTSTVYSNGDDFSSAIRTMFHGGQDALKVFITRFDKRETDGQMTFKTFYTPTYAEALEQHINLVKETAL